MLLCYVIDSGLSTSLLLLATLIIMFYITFIFYISEKTQDRYIVTRAPDSGFLFVEMGTLNFYDWLIDWLITTDH